MWRICISWVFMLLLLIKTLTSSEETVLHMQWRSPWIVNVKKAFHILHSCCSLKQDEALWLYVLKSNWKVHSSKFQWRRKSVIKKYIQRTIDKWKITSCLCFVIKYNRRTVWRSRHLRINPEKIEHIQSGTIDTSANTFPSKSSEVDNFSQNYLFQSIFNVQWLSLPIGYSTYVIPRAFHFELLYMDSSRSSISIRLCGIFNFCCFDIHCGRVSVYSRSDIFLLYFFIQIFFCIQHISIAWYIYFSLVCIVYDSLIYIEDRGCKSIHTYHRYATNEIISIQYIN